MLKKFLCLGWMLGHCAAFWLDANFVGNVIWLLSVLGFVIGLLVYLYIWHKQGQWYLRLLLASFCGCCSLIWGMTSYHDQYQERLTQRVIAQAPFTGIIYVGQMHELNAQGHKHIVQWLQPNTPARKLVIHQKTGQDILKLGAFYTVQGEVQPIRGYSVPHAFNTEQWSLQQGIMGRLKVHAITQIAPVQLSQFGIESKNSTFGAFKLWIEQQRIDLRNFLFAHQRWQQQGLMLALVTGDESLLVDETKQLFLQLGISHLLAISGPHVLILAAIWTWLTQQCIARFFPLLYLKISKQRLSAIIFILGVSGYTLFCGAEIPALRTLVFSLVVSACVFFHRPIDKLSIILFSASILLWFDALFIQSAGFWLSFGASFILLHLYQSIQTAQRSPNQSVWQYSCQVVRLLWQSQWKMFVALFPLVIVFFKQVAWVAPFTNMIAIPVLGAVVVPLNIVATMLWLIFGQLAIPLFALVNLILSMLVWCLELLSAVAAGSYQYIALTPLSVGALSLGLVILFLPRGLIPRYWSILCFLPVIFQSQQHKDFEFALIDVGQGQGIYLQSQGQSMLVDTGGSWNEAQYSLADWIWIPFLSRQGIRKLDYVVLTHLDVDHSGAFERLSQKIPIEKVIANEQVETHIQQHVCQSGQQWYVGQISVEVLSPAHTLDTLSSEQRNEHSCVLLLTFMRDQHAFKMLIMGDAGWPTEYQLLAQGLQAVDILVLGHHGSRHSSAYDFLKQLKPKLALVSAGFENRYGHPSQEVQKRLEALDIPLWNTAVDGTIQITSDPHGVLYMHTSRTRMKIPVSDD